MKKVLLTAPLAAVLALASCSNDETITAGSDNSIKFDVVAGNVSRSATDTYSTSNLPASFYMCSGLGTKQFIMNDLLTRDGTSANYKSGTVRYWPNEALNFYAYTAATNSAGNTIAATYNSDDSSLSLSDVTIKTNSTEQTDLLYAARTSLTKPTDGTAHYNFRHALCGIYFDVKNVLSETALVVVHEVSICNMFGTGKLTFGTTDTSTNYDPASDIANNTYTYTGFNDCSWDFTGYSQTATSKLNLSADFGTTYNTVVPMAVTGTDTKNGLMLVIPQTTPTAWSPDPTDTYTDDLLTLKTPGCYLAVNCTIYNIPEDTNGAYTVTKDDNDNYEVGNLIEIFDGTLIKPFTPDWKAGTIYRYTLRIGGDNGGYDITNPSTPFDYAGIDWTVEVNPFEEVLNSTVIGVGSQTEVDDDTDVPEANSSEGADDLSGADDEEDDNRGSEGEGKN